MEGCPGCLFPCLWLVSCSLSLALIGQICHLAHPFFLVSSGFSLWTRVVHVWIWTWGNIGHLWHTSLLCLFVDSAHLAGNDVLKMQQNIFIENLLTKKLMNKIIFLQGVGWVGASPSPHSHLVRWQSGNQSLLETGLRSGSGCVGRFERVDCLRPGSGQFWLF